ncbi:hypothetical protein K3495_g8649 [Podosphaera aphanis]|nr:hypothetical protein K3495_g8649 [Podosphaera aphanis]
MKKLRKFTLQLPGRKLASTTQSEVYTDISNPISKAQRILGTEFIDLNISTPGNKFLHQKCNVEPPTHTSPRIKGFRQGISADNRPVRQYATVPFSESSQNDGTLTSAKISTQSKTDERYGSQQESPCNSPQECGIPPSSNQCLRKTKILRTRPVTHVAKCVSDSFLESQKRFRATCTRKASAKKLRPVTQNSYDDRPVTSASWIETQACRMDSYSVGPTSSEFRKSDLSQADESDNNKGYFDLHVSDYGTNILAPPPLVLDEKRPEPHSNTSDGSIPIFLAYSEPSSSERPSTVSSADLTETSVLSLTIDSDDEDADSFPVYLKTIKSCTPAIQEIPTKKISPTIPEFLDVRCPKKHGNPCLSCNKVDNLTLDSDLDREKQLTSHSEPLYEISQCHSHFSGLRYRSSSQGPPSPPSSINSQPSLQTCRIMSVTEEERALLETLRLQKAQMRNSPIEDPGSPADFRRLAMAI